MSCFSKKPDMIAPSQFKCPFDFGELLKVKEFDLNGNIKEILYWVCPICKRKFKK